MLADISITHDGQVSDGEKGLLRNSHFSSFLLSTSKIALVQFLENCSGFVKTIWKPLPDMNPCFDFA